MSVFQTVLKSTGTRVIALSAALIAGFEGVRYYVYDDGHGNLTACYGQTSPSFKKGMTFTEEECIQMLITETRQKNSQMNNLVKVEYTSEWQEAALTSFVYNVGIGNFKSSTLLKQLNNKKHDKACDELYRWVFVNKKDCRNRVNQCAGIPVRRAKEWNWCMGNISPSEQLEYRESIINILKETG